MIGMLLRVATIVVALVLSGFAYAQPSPDARIEDASAARDAFWRAIDVQDYAGAYAMLTPGMQAMVTGEQYAQLTPGPAPAMARY